MDYIILILALPIVGGILSAILITSLNDNKKKVIEQHLGKIPEFTATQKVISTHGNTALAVDEDRRKICLAVQFRNEVHTRVMEYGDLISSEIVEDGAAVTKFSRSSQIGGALIGGLALGGVGAIIGGLSGKTQVTQKVKSIDLRITVNDIKIPVYHINFLNLETTRGGLLYNQVMSLALYWHGILDVLMKRADVDDQDGNRISGVNSREITLRDPLVVAQNLSLKNQPNEELKQCPYCVEMIKLHARKCRFCSTEFTESELESHIAESRSKKQAEQDAEKTALEHARIEDELRVNRELAKSQNCLLTAIKARDVPQLEILLSLGCDPNAKFDSGTYPLVYAVEKGDAGIVSVLLNAGAKIPENSNLLHTAVRVGSVEILLKLISYGANIDEKNLLGLTALKVAEKREPRYDDILGVLKDAPLRFPCPKCKTVFEVSQEFRGRQGTCRTCSTKVKVPS